MAEHNLLGQWGEDRAADYLINKGYSIRHRNWKFGHRDIDIIAEKDGMLVFVEVKTRRNNVFTEPEMAVDSFKVKNLITAAGAYITYFRIDDEYRFDIIAVLGLPDNKFVIRHTENAFLPQPY